MSDKQKDPEKEAPVNEAVNGEQSVAPEEALPTPEKDPLELAQEEASEWKDKYLRLFAEFENYKRRMARERLELFSTANQEVMQALLPVLDDFSRAMKAAEQNQDAEALKSGLTLIKNKLFSTLQQKGLKTLDVNPGDAFDVDRMEAITRIPAPDENLKGKVVDVIEPGYQLGERVIRYAKVVVGD